MVAECPFARLPSKVLRDGSLSSGCTVAFDPLYSRHSSRQESDRPGCGQIPLTTVSHSRCATLPPSEGYGMPTLSGIVKQLKKERDRVRKQLLGLETALTAFASAYSGSTPSPKRRKTSAKSRAKIAAAQRARWAKVRGNAKVAPKRTMSASSRSKITAAQRARWAKFRKSKA